MKAILITDLHSQKRTLDYLKIAIKQESPNAIICCGDITNFGDSDFCSEFIGAIKESGLAAYVVWGNADCLKSQQIIKKSPYNSHLVKRSFGKNKVFGIGYIEDIPPLDPKDIAGSILITHLPPNQGNLKKPLGNAPQYHISGHLHYAKWVKKYPSCVYIQVPTLQEGWYGVFEANKGLVDFKKAA